MHLQQKRKVCQDLFSDVPMGNVSGQHWKSDILGQKLKLSLFSRLFFSSIKCSRPAEELLFTGSTTVAGEILQTLTLTNNSSSNVAFKVSSQNSL